MSNDYNLTPNLTLNLQQIWATQIKQLTVALHDSMNANFSIETVWLYTPIHFWEELVNSLVGIRMYLRAGSLCSDRVYLINEYNTRCPHFGSICSQHQQTINMQQQGGEIFLCYDYDPTYFAILRPWRRLRNGWLSVTSFCCGEIRQIIAFFCLLAHFLNMLVF